MLQAMSILMTNNPSMTCYDHMFLVPIPRFHCLGEMPSDKNGSIYQPVTNNHIRIHTIAGRHWCPIWVPDPDWFWCRLHLGSKPTCFDQELMGLSAPRTLVSHSGSKPMGFVQTFLKSILLTWNVDIPSMVVIFPTDTLCCPSPE